MQPCARPHKGSYRLTRSGTTTFTTAFVAATGRREAYYSDHHGSAHEFVAAKRGYLFRGSGMPADTPRGSSSRGLRQPPCDISREPDQVANSGDGSVVATARLEHARVERAAC
jgi:hypothetical protein